MALNISPVRTSNEDLIKDGLINLSQVNRILRNPELPKSRLQMKTILKRFNEEKRRAITLSRIQCTANSSYFINNFENTSNQNNSNRELNPSENQIIEDLDQISDFEVKFTQLPQQLLINILGEAFSKYENQIKRSEESVRQINASVKEEVVSDSEDDCRIMEDIDDNNIEILKQKLKDSMNEYKSVEEEEIIVSNKLESVCQQLEDKLSALRECIEFCETLKQQNFTITQKSDRLKDRKTQLMNEIMETKERLLKINERLVLNKSQSTASDKNNSFEIIDISQDLNTSLYFNKKKRNSNEINPNKNKVKENKRTAVESTPVPKKLKNISTEVNRTENMSTNELLMNSNEVDDNPSTLGINETLTQIIPDLGPTSGDNSHSTQSSINMGTNLTNSEFNANSNQKSKAETQLRGISHSSEPTISSVNSRTNDTSNATSYQSLSAPNSLPKPLSTNCSLTAQNRLEPMDTTPIHNSLNVSNEVTKRKVESNNRFRNSHKRYDGNNRLNTDCDEILCDIFPNKSSSDLLVTCLYAKDNELYVGLNSGVINKYNICGESLELCDSLPELDNEITALHLIKTFNYLFCGTSYGLFAYLNCSSNDKNYSKIQLRGKNTITCFESSATILFIGTRFGFIHRFGLMSNDLINEFKCDFWVNDLKLINDSSERLIVCGKTEISIRNSTDGSLLQTLDKTGDMCCFLCVKILSNKIVICSNIKPELCHRFQVYDNSFRVINDFNHQLLAKLFAVEDNLFYVLTNNRDLYCFDIEKRSILWSIKIRCNSYDMICMTVDNKRIIIGTRFGKVMQIIPDSSAPIVCKSNRCGYSFARISDIVKHFRDGHALPFYRSHHDLAQYFHCPWIECDLRIRINFESIEMIVEHMKTHVI